MKFSLCLCVTLTLAHRGFARVIMQNTEGTINSLENPVTSNEETSSMETENILESSSESARPKCPKNMKPEEVWVSEKRVWKCFCEPPLPALPMNNACVKPFRQGRCTSGNIVIQQQPSVEQILMEPGCIPNTCRNDGLIFYNGKCHNITRNRHLHRMSAIDAPSSRLCEPGSRLDQNGICRKKL